jgi:hypothetical protein
MLVCECEMCQYIILWCVVGTLFGMAGIVLACYCFIKNCDECSIKRFIKKYLTRN